MKKTLPTGAVFGRAEDYFLSPDLLEKLEQARRGELECPECGGKLGGELIRHPDLYSGVKFKCECEDCDYENVELDTPEELREKGGD